MSFKNYLLNESDMLSKKAIEWLNNWQWKKGTSFPSIDIINELKRFIPSSPILELYRFISLDDIYNEKNKKLRSYTKNKKLALTVIEHYNPMRGYVEVWYEVPTKLVLVDFTLIPKQYDNLIDNAQMEEVIIYGF